MDIYLPDQSGIECTRIVKETRPHTAVIMYATFEDHKKLFDSFCAGANRIHIKDNYPFKSFDAIKEVMEGKTPMSPTIVGHVRQSPGRKQYTNIMTSLKGKMRYCISKGRL